MLTLTKLQTYLAQTVVHGNFNVGALDPHMANGLQIKGSESIEKIGFAVSASLRVFKKAQRSGCNALIVHHSVNSPTDPPHYDQIYQDRIAFLIQNNISLFGYHFYLDSHPELGNNAQILKLLGAQEPFEQCLFHGDPWGYIASISPKTIDDIIKITSEHFSPQMQVYQYGPEHIKTVAAISGRGVPFASYMQYLIDKKVDLYITGENSEWVRELYKEAEIHYIAGGHYHTEKLGLFALIKKIEQDLGIGCEFIDLENTV